MKINSDFKLKNIAGEHIVVNSGANQVNMTKVISMNATSSWLWEQLESKDFEKEYAVSILCDYYDVQPSVAEKDVEAWVATLKQHNIIL